VGASRQAVPPAGEQDDPGDPESVARTVCLRLLTQRARTRAELAKALAGRGVPATAADRVLDRFAEVGLIDDAAVAESFALSQHRQRGLSARAVAVKLRQRGLDERLVQSAVDQIGAESEFAAASRLAQRKLRALNSTDPAIRRRRIYGLLMRRGYPADLVMRVVRMTVDESDTGQYAGEFSVEHDT